MNMNPKVKSFIETHIEEIDNEYWVVFWELAVMEFPNNLTVAQIAETLEAAGIDTATHRFMLIDEYIRKAIDSLYTDKIGLKLTIFQLIDRIPLDRRFGFNLRQIESHIVNERDHWDCDIWRDANTWLVRRH